VIQGTPKIALVTSGDHDTRSTATLEGSRLRGVAESLREVGVEAELAVYHDEVAEEVREKLSDVDGVLVWVNPIEQGRDRTVLDGLLRDLADAGVFVSAHPDTILKMGTKEVLFRTRRMSWGSDTHLYATADELRELLPLRLEQGRPRVLKQYRGNGGNGVWKIERHPTDPTLVRARHALRGSVEEDTPLSEFLAQCDGYFARDGRIVDQEYQERLVDGMVRCYMAGDEVAGFGHQEINALFPAQAGVDPSDAPQPGPRLYHPPTAPHFQDIKRRMEEEWLGDLCRTLDLDRGALPVIWDADLMYGPKTSSGEDTYVLCEINVSSVYPLPDDAIGPIARVTKERLLTPIPYCSRATSD
jgi:hypothetical protein